MESIQFSDDNGKTWQNCTSGGFESSCFGIAYNPEDKMWVAVGDNTANADANDPVTTIKFSKDNGKTWQNCTSGGFAGGAGGSCIAYNPEDKVWVAGGDNTGGAGALTSIKFSKDNGKNWQNCVSGGFTVRCEAIAYNPEDKVWVAVGNGDATTTIKFSKDNGKTWQNCTSGGFC